MPSNAIENANEYYRECLGIPRSAIGNNMEWQGVVGKAMEIQGMAKKSKESQWNVKKCYREY